ncbi:MAG: GGDEF domain-containing phosphodiesterase [Acidobacteriota bacterium]
MSAAADQGYWELRAEWLKLRGCLFDPNTGLPALPAVIDGVRRRLEDGERIGTLFVELASEERVEEVCGWQSYDRLLRQVAQVLEGFRERALQPRDTLAIVGVRGDAFLLFVGGRPRQALDERRLARLRESLTKELGARLRFDAQGDLPRGITISCGAAMLESDPTVRLERSVYKGIEDARTACRRQRQRQHSLRLSELRRILAAGDVTVRYQPIVGMGDGHIHGFEALSSGPSGDVFESPEMLFSFAEETDHIIELERLCRSRAIRGAESIVKGQKLFLNCSAHGFVDPHLVSDSMLDEIGSFGLKPECVVFEVTERVAITEWKEFRAILAELRRRGFAVAIDDMGAGYSSLQAVAEVEPDYLKFDISLVRDIHLSPIKRNLLETLVVLAGKINAQVIAEGVESQGEFDALRAMNIPFAQGFFLAQPGRIPDPPDARLFGGSRSS